MLIARLAHAAGVLVLAAPSMADTKPHYLRPLDGTLPKPFGPVVYRVIEGSPAATAGLMVGDTVVSIDGWPVATHGDLTHILRRRRDPGPARVLVGKPSGRREVRVMPRGEPLRMGVSLPGVQVTSKMVQIDDAGGAVLVSASEWAGYTLVQIAARNRGTRPVAFGPSSVAAVDGRGVTLKWLSPESAIAGVYGSDEEAAGATAADRRTRDENIRSARASQMKSGVIPPGGETSGDLCVGRIGLHQPLTIRVTLAERVYTMRFGRAPRR